LVTGSSKTKLHNEDEEKDTKKRPTKEGGKKQAQRKLK
jgi:hypothetical protein